MWIDRDKTSEQVLVLLDAVESDEEDEIDNLMSDSDTKFIMKEEIAVEKNENNSNDGGDLLVPDTNVHIVLAENGEDETKKAKKSKGKQKEIPSFTWKKRANPHERKECTLKAELIIEEMQEHCTPFNMFQKVTNLDELKLDCCTKQLVPTTQWLWISNKYERNDGFFGHKLWASNNYQLFKVIENVDSLSEMKE